MGFWDTRRPGRPAIAGAAWRGFLVPRAGRDAGQEGTRVPGLPGNAWSRCIGEPLFLGADGPDGSMVQTGRRRRDGHGAGPSPVARESSGPRRFLALRPLPTWRIEREEPRRIYPPSVRTRDRCAGSLTGHGESILPRAKVGALGQGGEAISVDSCIPVDSQAGARGRAGQWREPEARRPATDGEEPRRRGSTDSLARAGRARGRGGDGGGWGRKATAKAERGRRRADAALTLTRHRSASVGGQIAILLGGGS